MKVYLRLLFAFLGVVFILLTALSVNFLWSDRIKPKQQLFEEVKKLKNIPTQKVDYGLPVYAEAISLIRNKDIHNGVSKLHDLLKFYPESDKCNEANRIIGEYNCDSIFARSDSVFKSEYEVKRGDALNSIAQTFECTPGYILKINRRLGTSIQPGERLVVCDLNYSVMIKLTDSHIILMNQDEKLIKKYKINQFKLPQGCPNSLDTKIKGLVVGDGAKFISLGSKEFASSYKQIRFDRRGLNISKLSNDADENTYSTGFFVSQEDLEELAILLKSGINVYIRK